MSQYIKVSKGKAYLVLFLYAASLIYIITTLIPSNQSTSANHTQSAKFVVVRLHLFTFDNRVNPDRMRQVVAKPFVKIMEDIPGVISVGTVGEKHGHALVDIYFNEKLIDQKLARQLVQLRMDRLTTSWVDNPPLPDEFLNWAIEGLHDMNQFPKW